MIVNHDGEILGEIGLWSQNWGKPMGGIFNTMMSDQDGNTSVDKLIFTMGIQWEFLHWWDFYIETGPIIWEFVHWWDFYNKRAHRADSILSFCLLKEPPFQWLGTKQYLHC